MSLLSFKNTCVRLRPSGYGMASGGTAGTGGIVPLVSLASLKMDFIQRKKICGSRIAAFPVLEPMPGMPPCISGASMSSKSFDGS